MWEHVEGEFKLCVFVPAEMELGGFKFLIDLLLRVEKLLLKFI